MGLRTAGRRDVIVGSKNFTEQIVLGELVAQVIERQGAERRAAIQSRRNRDRAPGADQRRHRRLRRVLGHVAHRDLQPAAVDRLEPGVRAGPRSLRGARRHRAAAAWLQQHLRDPRQGRGCASDLASRRSAISTSFAGAKAGFGYEFLERPDGFKGLSAAYGLQLAGPAADHGPEPDLSRGRGGRDRRHRRRRDERPDRVADISSCLDDDRHYFPAYDAVPVVRASVLLSIPRSARRLRRSRARFPPPRCGG